MLEPPLATGGSGGEFKSQQESHPHTRDHLARRGGSWADIKDYIGLQPIAIRPIGSAHIREPNGCDLDLLRC